MKKLEQKRHLRQQRGFWYKIVLILLFAAILMSLWLF